MLSKGFLNDDVGKLILRLTVGGLLLFHGVHKLLAIGATTGWLGGRLAAHHLPEFIAYGVYVGEVVAPLMLLLGYFTRIGGLLVVINMLVAVLLAHQGDVLSLNSHGGWQLELQGFYLFGGLALVFLGGGKHGINRH